MSAGDAVSASNTAATGLPGDEPNVIAGGPTWWDRLDERFSRWSDILNPILIKEARQALRSRQFLWVLFALLAGAWGYSILYLLYNPGAAYGALGKELFFGYYMGLSVALLAVVPFGAFRSLAAEREDRTHELVGITNLSPRRIVAGKLAAAMLQAMVFISIVAPCLAFTYLLRGIDLLLIGYVIGMLTLASLGAAMLALFLAAMAKQRAVQAFLALVVIGSLIGLTTGSWPAAYEFLEWSPNLLDREFVLVNLGILTAYVTTFAMLFEATTSLLTFEADNRSTRLRIGMVVQQLCFFGWIGWGYFQGGGEPMLFILGTFSGAYWWIMGTLLTAESPQLSPRVRRGLPRSPILRGLGCLLQPGPATGLFLAFSTLATVLSLGLAVVGLFPVARGMFGGFSRWDQLVHYLGLGFCYVVVYLSTGKLLVDWIRARANFGVALPILFQVLLLVIGCGAAFAVELAITGGRPKYNVLQTFNVFWTLTEVLVPSARGGSPQSVAVVTVIMAILAGLHLVLQFRSLARELRQAPVEAPRRVAEDAALDELKRFEQPTRKSPWDEEPSATQS